MVTKKTHDSETSNADSESHGESSVHHEHSEHVKKRPNWFRIGLAVAVLGILVALWFLVLQKPASATALVAGDTAKLSYTMQLADGKVISSDTEEFAIGSSAISSAFGLSSDKIDKAIEGKKISEEETITLTPAEAFGEYDESKIFTVNKTEEVKRREELNRTFTQKIAQFKAIFGEDAVLDKVYSPQGAIWKYKVTSIDNSTDTVVISQETEVGKLIPLNEVMSLKILNITTEKIFTELQAENQTVQISSGNLSVTETPDKILFTLTPTVGNTIILGLSQGKVVSFNDTSITIDGNPEYAGKTIVVKLKVLEITKPKTVSASGTGSAIEIEIAGAPTLDVFVMTHCPYGLQMEKAVLPVYNLLRDKANIKIRFVSYTMHGDTEEQETRRQLCIREEQAGKKGENFWNYLECFVKAGDSGGCIATTGLNKADIESCMTIKAESYWQVDKQLNTEYGVQGSPTTILNGKETSMQRSPDAVKEAICNAFTTKPSECSQQLSTAAASSGFGTATTSSNSSSGGGCGA